MKKIVTIRVFLKDDHAVSEEFSLLPALSVVMVGFGLFVVLLAQTYITYNENVQRLQQYQTAESILQRVTNPDCVFIREGGLVDITAFQTHPEFFKELCQQYEKSHLHMSLHLSYENNECIFPETTPVSSVRRIVVSRCMGIFLNEAQTVPGILSILLWEAD